MPDPIPVVCDRCREEGEAGEDPFEAFGALLDFDPVPRRAKRADGWDEELQRAFIALLALTGSAKAATRALGKSEFGITQLVRAEGSEGFVAAMDEAIAISKDERRRRIAEAVRSAAADRDSWTPPRPAWAKTTRGRRSAAAAPPPPSRSLPPRYPAPGEEEWRDELGYTKEERTKIDALEPLFNHYVQRIVMERRARLEGRICAADFYVRQITVHEIMLQLLAGGSSRVALQEIQRLRLGPYRLTSIAETVMSRLLDDARRQQWAKLGEPERPPPLGPDLTIDKGELKLFNTSSPAAGLPYNERLRAEEEAFAAAAREQIEWERTAAEQSAAWRERLEGEEEPPGFPSK